MDIFEAIKARRSRRVYASKVVEPEKIEKLLEALRWAPSSRNTQPWNVIVVTSKDALEKIYQAYTPGNQLWIHAVPLFFIFIAKPEWGDFKGGQPGYLLDNGMAAQNVMLAATALGLASTPMWGWDEHAMRLALDIPEGYRVVLSLALGYAGNLADFPEEVQLKDQRERVRKETKEIVFFDSYGNRG